MHVVEPRVRHGRCRGQPARCRGMRLRPNRSHRTGTRSVGQVDVDPGVRHGDRGHDVGREDCPVLLKGGGNYLGRRNPTEGCSLDEKFADQICISLLLIARKLDPGGPLHGVLITDRDFNPQLANILVLNWAGVKNLARIFAARFFPRRSFGSNLVKVAHVILLPASCEFRSHR